MYIIFILVVLFFLLSSPKLICTGILKKQYQSYYPNYYLGKLPEKIKDTYTQVYQQEDINFLEIENVVEEFNGVKNQPPSEYRRDTHDHYIQMSLSKNFLENFEEPTPTEKKLEIEDKYNILLKHYPLQKNNLKKIYSRNTNMILYDNKSEFEILWGIFVNGNDNVKAQLGIVLNEISLEGLKCATGNVSRILECQYIDNPEKIPLQKKDVQQLLLLRASQLSEHPVEKMKEILVEENKDVYPEHLILEIIDSWNLD